MGFFFAKQVKVMQRRSGQGGTFLVHSVQTNVSGKNFWLTSVKLIGIILSFFFSNDSPFELNNTFLFQKVEPFVVIKIQIE